MKQEEGGFYQVAYSNEVEKERRRFDMVFGSGVKGQTYLSWTGNRLFQLPITFFSPAHQWSNSPGYPGKVVFNRPITSRCLECHTTFAQKISDANSEEKEEFDRTKIVFGIDCEKCHGPAAQHVDFQQKNPSDKVGQFIIKPSAFTRQQNLDLCALCHGGKLNKLKPSFSFAAGDTLSDFFSKNATTIAAGIDVHGNQLGLLANSKCFTLSQMTCMSCHNIHENEKGKTVLFSQRCITCHSDGHQKICKMTNQIGKAIQQNCIDCHMPKQTSQSVAVLLQGDQLPTAALMRTHYIKVYPNETNKVMVNLSDLMKKNGK
jgi:mono/diheme cytochrome c family protein